MYTIDIFYTAVVHVYQGNKFAYVFSTPPEMYIMLW